MVVRGGSANPSSLKFQSLMNKQSIAENEVFKPERQRPSIISTHTEDTIMIQDPFFFTKLKTKTQKYYAPWEPDGVLLKYWCRFNHMAKRLHDHSFSKNYTYPHGKPKLCLGPDDGVKGGRIITKMNQDNDMTNPDWFSTPDHSSIRVSTATNGFSIYLEFYVDSLGSVDGNFDPTLQYKFDDSNNRRCIRFDPDDGRLHFHVREGGVDTNFYTPNNTIIPKALYKCWFRYNPTSNTATVTVNNIAQSNGGGGNPSLGDSTTELRHGRRGSIDGGYPFVRFIDSRWYNFIVDDDHIKNIWNNGRSICASPAINLDGVNNHIDLGVDTTNWSKTLTKFSFSIWQKPDVVYDIDYRNLVVIGDANDEIALMYLKSTVSGSGVNALEISITKDAYTTFAWVDATTTVSQLYNNIIVTFDSSGSNNLKMYHNGALIGSANYAFPLAISSTVKMMIGRYEHDTLGSFHYDGKVRDFRWWNNTTLTEPQVIAVRDNLSTAPLPNFWLKMNEGNSNPRDYINRAKLGTLSNGASWILSSSHRPTEFGSLAVAGYTRFNDEVDAGGYDSTGYDSTGFDTT